MTLIFWLQALGPFVASIVALFIAFLPSIIKWYNRPILEITFKNEEPFCRKGPIPGGTAQSYRIRLRVENKGRSVARRCEGKLTRIIDLENNEDLVGFDPVLLKWIGSEQNQIDINKSEYEYLAIMWMQENYPGEILLYASESPEAKLRIPKRNYIFHIGLYGENVRPYQKSYSLEVKPEIDEIQMVEHK